MTAPNMAGITASLQNCSLNQHRPTGDSSISDGIRVSSSDSGHNSDTTVELHSDVSLPYHWEQCLDLKTGEIYYINWRTGMKVTEDPRTMGDYYSEEEEDDDESSYDESEESSSESSPSSVIKEHHYREEEEEERDNNVLVVAGCKSCLMYFMVPKQVGDCPKCSGQLLHFDRSENSSP